MPSDFTVNIEIETSIPNFMNADVPLRQIANRLANDARKNIRQQTNFDGGVFAELSEKTIRDKKRKNYAHPNMALFAKGIMYRAIHVYKLARNRYAVGVIPRGKPPRDLVALIHQEQGVNQHTRITRRFLGFSQHTLHWANLRMQRWLRERAQKASKKYIKFKY